MRFNPAVFDVWVFRRTPHGVAFLVLRTSQTKADRYFSGGRFWQIPCGVFQEDEPVPIAIDRELSRYGLRAQSVWAAEHVYSIYNRRFHEIQLVSVYAAESSDDTVSLDEDEHSEYAWLGYAAAIERVHFRGLKEGLRWTQEYVTGIGDPAPELRLR